MWGSFSDERTGLSFKVAAGPRQRSHTRLRVPWNSRRYFTLSDSRLPFSSPPTTHRATMEVFPPPPHFHTGLLGSESKSYVMTDGQSASLSWIKAPISGLEPDIY
jgi:hypothetical protein